MRCRQRDLERYRALRRRIEREGRDPFALFFGEDPQPEAPLEDAPPLDPAADLQLQSRPPQ